MGGTLMYGGSEPLRRLHAWAKRTDRRVVAAGRPTAGFALGSFALAAACAGGVAFKTPLPRQAALALIAHSTQQVYDGPYWERFRAMEGARLPAPPPHTASLLPGKIPLAALPPEDQPISVYLHPQARVLGRDGSLLGLVGDRCFRRLSEEEIPPRVIHALVAAEDRRYFEHPGVDVRGLARSALVNLKEGRIVQGGSTLTQQLARQTLLSNERSLGRKGREIALALLFTQAYSKQEVLAEYLNTVEFGTVEGMQYRGRVVGLRAAAKCYFDKAVPDLTLPEAAFLMGRPKFPSNRQAGRALDRMRYIVDNMAEAGLVSEAEAADAKAWTPEFRFTSEPDPFAFVRDEAVRALEKAKHAGFCREASYSIRTTADPRYQALAQRTVDDFASDPRVFPGGERRDLEAALLVARKDGGILAMAQALPGGQPHISGDFNQVMRRREQAGSLFKPFIAAWLLDAGNRSLEDKVLDGWVMRVGEGRERRAWPENWDGKYLGWMTMRAALLRSRNGAFARLGLELGVDSLYANLSRAGVPLDDENDRSVSLILGGVHRGLTLPEILGLYSSLVNGGVAHEPYLVESVSNSLGATVYSHAPVARMVCSPQAAGQVLDVLKEVPVRGTAAGLGKYYAFEPGSVVGKTATTNEKRVAYFAAAYFPPEGAALPDTLVILARIRVEGDEEGLYGGQAGVAIVGDFLGRSEEELENSRLLAYLKSAAPQGALPPPADFRQGWWAALKAPPGLH